MTSSISIVAYIALFAAVGFVFLLVNLLVGRLMRPANPNKEKLEIYECGEPTIGSSFVQFDLRFYVVALLFIIFDVEVAFFFPWATVFGKATNLPDAPRNEANRAFVAQVDPRQNETDGSYTVQLTKTEDGLAGAAMMTELGFTQDGTLKTAANNATEAEQNIQKAAQQLSFISLIDILVFFSVLMVGFAYVWMRGDLNWVRAVTKHTATQSARGAPPVGLAKDSTAEAVTSA